ncbi:hypothetical protein DSAG12_03093 [Promethearchaeum syntrophicum]|uniref:Roadblock/LAMTOR2 domain-containing protein n=1 Tax=Promethearchaeum syntrophicum TaxID=2594042 RepID=A0A5B9DE39_9ARCH|nr:hypothetical protein [Candidatus Prometheoarchaeum syntrophicum]QEE17261.1 hypothetical protein DSAG12_03093 [Candidatus Prometheoarchaeum syntrophicum]
MSANPPNTDNKINWDGVVDQIFEMIGTDTAIINKYGIVLASKIPKLTPGKLISPVLWELILKREKLVSELETQDIHNLILESDRENIIFTFGENVYFMSKVQKTVDLNQYLPSINRIILTLDKSSEKGTKPEFSKIKLQKEYDKLIKESEIEMERDRLPVFKKLIRYMSKK